MLLASLELESGTDSAIKKIFVSWSLGVSDLLHLHMCPFMVCRGPSEDFYLSRKPFMIKNNPILIRMTFNSALTFSLFSNVATLIKKNKFVNCSVY
jgi:hypothetical protein